MKEYIVLGVMSGTSLDGIDLAICSLNIDKSWTFEILEATTIPYSAEWKTKLSKANTLLAYDFIKLHKEYGCFIGKTINHFLATAKVKPNFISSHGHTIFHQPLKKITFQIGDGAEIASETGITTISDFRSFDVALGGQGAPLVPIGDKLLFANYDYRLNLGGFANISNNHEDKVLAYDICPVNIVINNLMETIGQPYDRDGETAQKGTINKALLTELNNLAFYKQSAPKSLGKEWIDENIFPIMAKQTLSLPNLLRTFYEHVAMQIGNNVKSNKLKSVLITGGGAYNKFLISLLSNYSDCNFIVPQNQIVEFKEALIFALLGVLRLRNEANCLSSVTGAKYNNVGGVVHQVNK